MSNEDKADKIVLKALRARQPIPKGLWGAQDTLTDRELEVMRLIAAGLISSEVGSVLNIESETVRTHVKNALSRLQARNRTHAVAILMRQGLID